MAPEETELAKHGMDVAFSPVRDFFAKLAGIPAEEAGQTIADSIRVYRWKRSLKLLEDSKREAEARGIEPRHVPLKTLLPILEGASLEENDDMHQRWTALLLNASDPSMEIDVLPSFPEILGHLTPAEAKFLDGLYKLALESVAQSDGPKVPVVWTPMYREELEGTFSELGLSKAVLPLAYGSDDGGLHDLARFETVVDDLIRLRLLRTEPYTANSRITFSDVRTERYFLTSFGSRFVTACRKPAHAPKIGDRKP